MEQASTEPVSGNSLADLARTSARRQARLSFREVGKRVLHTVRRKSRKAFKSSGIVTSSTAAAELVARRLNGHKLTLQERVAWSDAAIAAGFSK